MRTKNWAGALAGVLLLCLASLALADAPSGAIFTTVEDGSEVNFNQYPSKEAVYLDGGPGPGAPQDAAGLDDGRYVFQVTNPNGKVLLSTDAAKFRQFDVVDGVIHNIVAPGHATGFDIDHGAVTVQLFPYNDTPNNGGVYKVWVTRVEDYLAACKALGVNNGLDVVDPGDKPANHHGFVPDDSKTDNFKVKKIPIVEIDTRFVDNATGAPIDGLSVTWTDTNGASNKKSAYFAPDLVVLHEAHVEAPEPGTHSITIENGEGYTVRRIRKPDGTFINGPGTVDVRIPNDGKNDLTVVIRVDVDWD